MLTNDLTLACSRVDLKQEEAMEQICICNNSNEMIQCDGDVATCTPGELSGLVAPMVAEIEFSDRERQPADGSRICD